MAPQVKVLVVDDSLTMRALFCGVFEETAGIQVLDHAASAEEARKIMAKHRPDVITLDIEMPGMNGLDFLEEIMRDKPMPVIMLSTLTQKGAAASLRALELGAIDCFSKPTRATIEEFRAIAPKLTSIVKAAASGKIKQKNHDAVTDHAPLFGYVPDDKVIGIRTSLGGADALISLAKGLPANAPPIVCVIDINDGLTDALIERLNEVKTIKVKRAEDGDKLATGGMYLVCDPEAHAVVDFAQDPTLRFIRADAVQGARPSANLLFASLAKGAGKRAVGVVLTGAGEDGVTGLAAIKAAGGATFVEDPASAMVPQTPQAAVDSKVTQFKVSLDQMGRSLALHCRKATEVAAS